MGIDDEAKKKPVERIGGGEEGERTRDPSSIQAGRTAISDGTHRDLVEAALDSQERLGTLQPRERIIALLGFRKDVEARYMPSTFKAVQVTVPRYRLADLTRIMERWAFPASTDFIGDPSDENVTQTYIIPHTEPVSPNFENIIGFLRSERITGKISLAGNTHAVVRVKGNGLQILGADFSETQDLFTEGEQVSGRREIKDPLEPETAHATEASFKSAREDALTLPRQGKCMYMVLKDDFMQIIQDTKNPYLQHVLRQLNFLVDSHSFHINRYNGYLVIVGTSERAGSYLTSLAKNIHKASRGRAEVLVKSGNVSYTGGQTFQIDGFYVNTASIETLETLGNDACVHESIYDPRRRRLKGRDGAQFLTIAERHPMAHEWYRIIDHRPSVELAVGGPDKFVGYKEELQGLEMALNDTETQLVVLRAAAGMGKSRLLSEVVKNMPSAIVMSLDPSGKNIQGSGLITIFDQIAEYVRQNEESGDFDGTRKGGESLQTVTKVRELREKSQDVKIMMAQRNPRLITGIITEALAFLRGKLGDLKLIIDDVHHIDKHSDVYLMSMLSEILSKGGKDKVLLSARPEERYGSIPQKTFERQIVGTGREKAKMVQLSGLDFRDEETAREFIYHSLPEEFRRGSQLAGDWWKILGQKAKKFPLAMMTYMDAIMAEHNRLTRAGQISILTVSERQIHLSKRFLEQIDEMIPEGDLDRYYKEKINRLPENLQRFMHCIALLGGTVTEAQIRTINEIVGDVNQDEFEKILLDGRYLMKQEDGKYHVQHQTIVDSMVAGIDETSKIHLSMNLYRHFRQDPAIHEDTKTALLHNIAPRIKPTDENFWREYTHRVGNSLDDAKKHNAYSHGYGIATTVLGDIHEIDELEPGKRTTAQTALYRMRRYKSSPVMGELVVVSLKSIAKNAIMLGRFSESEAAINMLLEVAKRNRALVGNVDEIYLMMFQLAYVRKDSDEMKKVYEEFLDHGARLDESMRAVYELQIAYLSGYKQGKPDTAAVMAIYEEKTELLGRLRSQDHKNYGEYLEIIKLVLCRLPFEDIKSEVETRADGKKFDEDVIWQPQALNDKQKAVLANIDEQLGTLAKISQERPLIFTPHSDMGLLELRAQIKAMLGQSREAVELFSENWRQANQMEMHKEAARAAKLKGDVQVIQALNRHNIDRERVVEALKTYGEEGIKSLTGVDQEDFYQFSIRVQRIRATGILALSYANEIETRKPGEHEREQLRKELEAHMEKALEDFKYINKHQKWKRGAKSPHIQYYVMGYIGHLLSVAKELKIMTVDFDNEEEFPYMNAQGVEQGKLYADSVVNEPAHDLNERYRKTKGLELMANFIKTQTHHRQ